jgi:hypothetical protein
MDTAVGDLKESGSLEVAFTTAVRGNLQRAPGAGPKMTRRSLFPLWEPALGHRLPQCIPGPAVLVPALVLVVFPLLGLFCLDCHLSAHQFIQSIVISALYRISLLSPPGLGTWFDSTSVTLVLSTSYTMQDRDETAHYKSRIISVVAATGIALAWYVCYNHPRTITSTSILI